MDAILNCPFCGGINCIEKVKENRTHIIKGKVYYGIMYLFKCLFCHESFTTTESDNESLKTLKPKIK